MKYSVVVIETSKAKIEVEADNVVEAKEKAEELYYNSKINFDYNDVVVDFVCQDVVVGNNENDIDGSLVESLDILISGAKENIFLDPFYVDNSKKIILSSFKGNCIERNQCDDIINLLYNHALKSGKKNRNELSRAYDNINNYYDSYFNQYAANYANDTLDNWELKQVDDGIICCGIIYNDSKHRFKNGTFINTSLIEFYDEYCIRTKNSQYRLGNKNGKGKINEFK